MTPPKDWVLLTKERAEVQLGDIYQQARAFYERRHPFKLPELDLSGDEGLENKPGEPAWWCPN